MSNISQTAANVVDGSNARIDSTKRAGATITAGMPVYIDPTDGLAKICDSNVSAALANCYGIALCGASAGQRMHIQIEGDINLGATLVVGESYILSADAGLIAPVADISTNYVTALGVARTAALLQLKINPTGIQRAA